jgi:hypothetical protein
MKTNISILENKKVNNKKRENQKLFNYLTLDKVENLKYEEMTNRYAEYLPDFKNSKMYINKEYGIQKIEFDKISILLRDNTEKSFFFNKFINEYLEYNDKNEKKISLKSYITNISGFIVLEDKNYIILDIEKDYIQK